MHNGLGKQERIHLRDEIDSLFEAKKGFVSYPVRVVYTLVPFNQHAARILISVPKRLHKRAVTRNKIKRRYREAYRVSKHPLLDYMLSQQREQTLLIGLVYLSDEIATYAQALKSTQSALSKLMKKLENESQ